jgi:hypothetical protein
MNWLTLQLPHGLRLEEWAKIISLVKRTFARLIQPNRKLSHSSSCPVVCSGPLPKRTGTNHETAVPGLSLSQRGTIVLRVQFKTRHAACCWDLNTTRFVPAISRHGTPARSIHPLLNFPWQVASPKQNSPTLQLLDHTPEPAGRKGQCQELKSSYNRFPSKHLLFPNRDQWPGLTV